MGSTRNTPNKSAGGPKVGGAAKQGGTARKGTASRKGATTKATTKKAASPARAESAPEPTGQLEVRFAGRIVAYQEVRKSSFKCSVTGGKVSVSATTADAPVDAVSDEQPVAAHLAAQAQPAEPPTPEEFDKIVEAGRPNEAIEFRQDPRVMTQIHEGEVVAEQQARERGETTKTKGK